MSDSGVGFKGDWAADVTLGRVPGVTRVSMFGRRAIPVAFSSISAGKDVWGGVNDEMTFATANESWEIVSDNIGDTVGGAGTEAVTIIALDFAYNQLATFQVNMNGTTPVVLPNGATYAWLNAAISAGVNSTAQRRKQLGTITIRVAGSAGDNTKVRGVMSPGTGALNACVYTAPVGFNTLIRAEESQLLSSGGGVTRGADFMFAFRSANGNIFAPRFVGTTDFQPYPLDAHTWIRVQPTTTFIVQCIYTGSNNITVGASFEAHSYRG